MGTGTPMGTDDTAAARLHLLRTHFLERPRTAPTQRSATTTIPGTPVDLAVVDHITASVAEVAEHTRAVNPNAGPLPTEAEDVYAWYREHTRHAPEVVRQRGDVIVYRQRLEHAIAVGDTSVVRPHRCPACATFGLSWQPDMGRVICLNRRCVTKSGSTRTWSLARIAYEHVAGQKSLRIRAT